ncbi:MAG: hypothetical protein EOO44_09575 [Flavobacterium sp.]|nr:MAG: hypothetical protein EOO44_09575 [Flavobacterium sp.]
MNTLKNKKLLKSIKLLAYYEIIGGVIGLLVLSYFFFVTSSIQLPLLIALSIGAIFFLFSIFSGYQLLYGNLATALNLSLITQMLQLISFAVSGYALLLVSGLMISVGLELTNGFEVSSGFSLSEYDFNFNNEKELVIFKINLVAVFLIYQIIKIKSKLTEINLETSRQIA